MGLTGLNASCQQGCVPPGDSGGQSRQNSVSLPFPASRSTHIPCPVLLSVLKANSVPSDLSLPPLPYLKVL